MAVAARVRGRRPPAADLDGTGSMRWMVIFPFLADLLFPRDG